MKSAVIRWKFTDGRVPQYYVVQDACDAGMVVSVMTIRSELSGESIEIFGVHASDDSLFLTFVEAALEYDRWTDEYQKLAKHAYSLIKEEVTE